MPVYAGTDEVCDSRLEVAVFALVVVADGNEADDVVVRENVVDVVVVGLGEMATLVGVVVLSWMYVVVVVLS